MLMFLKSLINKLNELMRFRDAITTIEHEIFLFFIAIQLQLLCSKFNKRFDQLE